MNSFKPNTFYVSFQFLFWIAYAVVFFLSIINVLSIKHGLLLISINISSQLALSVFNNLYLLPTFFDTRKYTAYFSVLLISIISVVFFIYYFGKPLVLNNGLLPSLNYKRYFIFVITTTISVFLINTGFYFFKQLFVERQRQDEIINQQLVTELKLLKAQINPHFLFNVLNNVYSLTQVAPEKVGEVILRLSDVLRYILYDVEEDKIRLEKEIENINALIALHRIGYNYDSNIDFFVRGDIKDKLMCPMLLLPFFENAFKHGNLFQRENSFIQSGIEINHHHLYFFIENSYIENLSKDKVGGIGIDNVKKRLELLYPGKYKLQIQKSEHTFKVHLKIVIDYSDD